MNDENTSKSSKESLTFSLPSTVFVYPLPKFHLDILFDQKACANIFTRALYHLVAPPKLRCPEKKNLIIAGNFKRSQ